MRHRVRVVTLLRLVAAIRPRCGDRIELVPVQPIKRMRGFLILKGIDTAVLREARRDIDVVDSSA